MVLPNKTKKLKLLPNNCVLEQMSGTEKNQQDKINNPPQKINKIKLKIPDIPSKLLGRYGNSNPQPIVKGKLSQLKPS